MMRKQAKRKTISLKHLKFDDDLAERVLDRVRNGDRVDLAFRAEGVTKVCYQAWLKKGTRAIKGKFHTFVEDLNDAVLDGLEVRKANLHRSSFLTPEIQDKIVALMRAGNHLETAALACGITRETLAGWMRKGRDVEAVEYVDFVHAVDEATGLAETEYVEVVRKAASDREVIRTKTTEVLDEDGDIIEQTVVTDRSVEFSAQDARWWLQHRHPRRWAPLQKLGGPDGEALQNQGLLVIPATVGPEQWIEMMSRYKKSNGNNYGRKGVSDNVS